MTQRNNVLSNAPALTQSSYQAAVAAMIRAVQARNEETDRDTADRVGVSATTIHNARNKKGDLNGLTVLRFGKEYGLTTIEPVLALLNAKPAPVSAVCTSDRDMPLHVAEAQVFVVKALSDNNEIDDDEIIENPDAIERAGQVFDTLRWRLASLRLRREQAA